MYKRFETEIAGRPFVVEIGKYAYLAGGAAMVSYGDTVVLSTATASAKPRDGIDFFPLSVDYEERLYSVGKIPGGFIKREGRPSEKAILASRVIDRPIRPLFPKDLRNDVAVVTTVMSVFVWMVFTTIGYPMPNFNLLAILGISAVATICEALSYGGIDNLTVPALTSILYYLVTVTI